MEFTLFSIGLYFISVQSFGFLVYQVLDLPFLKTLDIFSYISYQFTMAYQNPKDDWPLDEK